MLQNAAKKAIPSTGTQSATNNVPCEIKRIIAEKGKTMATLQRTHTPDSRENTTK